MVIPIMAWATISASDPVASGAPFTYRDSATFLEILRNLECYVETLQAEIDALNVSDTTNLDIVNAEMSVLVTQFNSAIAAVTMLIEGSHDESIAFDPTNGTRIEGLSTVISRVYDNLRIYGYFAKQYDELLITALAYDSMNYSARHYDLAVIYPTLNDVWSGE